MLVPVQWPRAFGDLVPPIVRSMPCHPKKVKVRADDEPQHPYKVTQRGLLVRCGTCSVFGHNARICKKPPNLNYRIYPKKLFKKKKPHQVRYAVSDFFISIYMKTFLI